MKYLNYGLVNISIPNLIEKSHHVINQMTRNPHFPDPFPSLIEIETCVNDLASLNEKVNQGNINLLIKLQDRFVRLKKSMILLGTFVAIKSEGNESVVLSSGFTVSENQECHEDLVII